MEKSVWQIIADALKKNKIDVYPPATKVGECTKPYVVVKASGSSQVSNYSTERHYYDFILYVPKNRYTDLEPFKRKVKEVIDTDLYPMLMPTGQETVDFYDDTVKAHMVSFLYRNNVRNTHL